MGQMITILLFLFLTGNTIPSSVTVENNVLTIRVPKKVLRPERKKKIPVE
jgi:hypothetical protein